MITTINWDSYGIKVCVMHCALCICKNKNVCLEQHAVKIQDNMKNYFKQYTKNQNINRILWLW